MSDIVVLDCIMLYGSSVCESPNCNAKAIFQAPNLSIKVKNHRTSSNPLSTFSDNLSDFVEVKYCMQFRYTFVLPFSFFSTKQYYGD